MNRTNFTWLTNHGCNYRCPYCFLDGKWDEICKRDIFFSTVTIIDAWARVENKYGTSYICVSGGEPTLYPDFINLMKEISKMHTIGICTNLSIDTPSIIDNLDSSRIDLSISFHPHFTKADDMLRKLSLLKQYNWRTKIMCVGWPPLIPDLDNYHWLFREFDFYVLPFWGHYKGKNYPTGYTEEEKNIVNKYIAEREKENFETNPHQVTGRPCRAGQVYAHIEPDGRVLRCCASGELIHENFYNNNFNLLDKPYPCSAQYCSCLEWVVC